MNTTRISTAGLFKKLLLQEVNPGTFCGEWLGSGKLFKSISPTDGQTLASVRAATPDQYERVVLRAREAFQKW